MKILGLRDTVKLHGFKGVVIDISKFGITVEGHKGAKRVFTLKEVERSLAGICLTR